MYVRRRPAQSIFDSRRTSCSPSEALCGIGFGEEHRADESDGEESGGLGPQHRRAKRHRFESGGLGLGDFGVGEAPLAADEEKNIFSGRLERRKCLLGFVGNQAQVVAVERERVTESERRREFGKMEAAALAGG